VQCVSQKIYPTPAFFFALWENEQFYNFSGEKLLENFPFLEGFWITIIYVMD
jgi:hypothetical protein